MNYIESYVPKKVLDASMMIGLAYLSFKALQLFKFLWRVQPIRFQNNLLQRYGEGSYAVVTGPTDGIGKQFAFSLAKRRFNLILVSRNMDKLKDTKKEIIQKYNYQLDIVLIQADFVNASEEGFFEQIAEKTQKYDVSILVNNVGIDKFSDFKDMDNHLIHSLIEINAFSNIMMTKLFIERINSRPKKGGITFTGSFSGFEPIKYFQVYGSTKALIHSFSKNLQNEYPNLDILHVTPGEVSTSLIFNKKGLLVASAESCAEGSLEDLGRYFHTDGALRHKLINSVLRCIPYSIFNFIFSNFTSKKMMQERKDGEKILPHNHSQRKKLENKKTD